MSRSLLWNIREQKDEGVYPNATDANVRRDAILARVNRVDSKQFGRPALTSADFQVVSVN